MKYLYRQKKRRFGKKHKETHKAYANFKNICRSKRAKLQFRLPEILKYQPKTFWNMIKQRDAEDIEVPLEDFTGFNKKIFYDENIPQDSYAPLTSPQTHHITQEELTIILEQKYNATKSRGLSKLPP
jgi:hypothetical protein